LASVFGSKARTARLENTASPIKTNWSTIAIPAPFWANAQAVSPVTHLDIDLAGQPEWANAASICLPKTVSRLNEISGKSAMSRGEITFVLAADDFCQS
jgi:hypothetical protein